MEYMNIGLIILFALASIWVLRKLLIMKKVVKIYSKAINTQRVLFIFAFVLCLFTLFTAITVLDVVKILFMALAIGLFTLLSDGIGEEGVYSNGSLIKYDDIKGYDLQKEAKKVSLVIRHTEQEKSGKTSQFYGEVFFELKKYDDVNKLIKSKIGNKYTRMPKQVKK